MAAPAPDPAPVAPVSSPYKTLKASVKPGAGQHLGFKPGKGYYAAAGAPQHHAAPAAATDPLAPMTASQIANAIAGYTTGLPKPLSDQQIRLRAQGLLDPVIKGITDRIGASTKAGAGAISGYANHYADALAQYQGSAASIYGGAEQSQAAADAAESGALRGGGSQLADQLAAKIGGISKDANVMQAGVGPVTSNANGAANATLGSGSAALAALIGQGTAAQDYAAKLPGLARGQGLSDIRDLELSSQKNLADQTGAAEQKLPDLVQALRAQSDSRATNIASVRNSASQYLNSRNDALNAGKAKNETAVTVAATKADAAVTVAQNKAIAAAEKAATSDAKPNASLSRAAGMIVDSNGNPIAGANGKPQILPGFKAGPNGTVVKVGKGQTGGNAATPAQVQSFLKGLPTYKTVTTKTSTGSTSERQASGHSMDYMNAYKWLRQHNVDDVTARTDLAGIYKRGEDGRAWLTNEEQSALRKASKTVSGPGAGSAVVTVHKSPAGSAYLTPAQYRILAKANQLPPGHWGNDPAGVRIWWIGQ